MTLGNMILTQTFIAKSFVIVFSRNLIVQSFVISSNGARLNHRPVSFLQPNTKTVALNVNLSLWRNNIVDNYLLVLSLQR